MSDEAFLICKRIVPGERPHTLSGKDRCTKCKAAVWRAHTSPPDIVALCVECLAEIDPEEELILMPPTEAQLADIAAWARKKCQ